VNENDTTATDEITFGDNDFLSAQVAILLGARLLVMLTDTAGLHTADPALDDSAELVSEVDDFGELGGYQIGQRTSAFGSGGMQSKVAAAEMASASGIPVVICDGTAAGTLAAAAAGERVGTSFVAHPERTRRGRADAAGAGLEPVAGRRHRGRGRVRGRRRRGDRQRRRGGRQGDLQLLSR
jgi:glutamate 5-kinase